MTRRLFIRNLLIATVALQLQFRPETSLEIHPLGGFTMEMFERHLEYIFRVRKAVG